MKKRGGKWEVTDTTSNRKEMGTNASWLTLCLV